MARTNKRAARKAPRLPASPIAFMEWWWQDALPGKPKRSGVFPRWYVIADDRGLKEIANDIQRLRRDMRRSLRTKNHPIGGHQVDYGLFRQFQRPPKSGIPGHTVRLTIVGYTPPELASVRSIFGRAKPGDTAAMIWKGLLSDARRSKDVQRRTGRGMARSRKKVI